MLKWILLVVWVSAGSTRAAAAPDSTNGWGYGYDSLLRDLGEWRKNPFVKVDSIGASVQGRAIWMVSVSDAGDSLGRTGESGNRKRRIFMHARTHPSEVQAQYVTHEAIRFLLDSGDASRKLRADFIWNFVPMFNPDGVEAGHDRLNAHLVNLEINWDKGVLEPEVMALKKTFEAFMAGPIPIEVALNMHSDRVNCTRFFFFHDAAGTSAFYEELERKYIAGVQSHFPGGIKNWGFARSWDDGTQLRYPEGFWWSSFAERVLALTYEDTNCPNAGLFDSTGVALVRGSADYIRDRIVASVRRLAAGGETRMLLSPEGIRLTSASDGAFWEVSDIRGRRLAQGGFHAGESLVAWNRLPAGSGRIFSVFRPKQTPERMKLPEGRN